MMHNMVLLLYVIGYIIFICKTIQIPTVQISQPRQDHHDFSCNQITCAIKVEKQLSLSEKRSGESTQDVFLQSSCSIFQQFIYVHVSDWCIGLCHVMFIFYLALFKTLCQVQRQFSCEQRVLRPLCSVSFHCSPSNWFKCKKVSSVNGGLIDQKAMASYKYNSSHKEHTLLYLCNSWSLFRGQNIRCVTFRTLSV